MAPPRAESVWPVLLLACLAGAISFVAFGFGALNTAAAEGAARTVTAEDSTWLARLDSAGARLSGLRAELEREEDGSAPETDGGRGGSGELRSASRSVDSLRARVERQRADSAALSARVRALSDSIESAGSVEASRLYGIDGGGAEPQWVECVEDGIVLQPQGLHIDLTELEDDPDAFRRAAREAEYVVFLVRPSGFAAFQEVRRLSEAADVRFGFEPVDENVVLRYGGDS